MRRHNVDKVEVIPSENQTWETVYQKVKDAIKFDPAHKDLADHVVIGRRTHAAPLRIQLSCTADSTLVLQEVQQIIGNAGIARVITEMGEILITHIDPLASEEELKEAIDRKLQACAGVTKVSMWQLSDGTKRARVRLPAKAAKQLVGQKLTVSCCISNIKEASAINLQQQRCYRCLERGHIAGECRSPVDRQKACIRCGAEGHLAKDCNAKVKCAVFSGPHRVGHRDCVRPMLRCPH